MASLTRSCLLAAIFFCMGCIALFPGAAQALNGAQPPFFGPPSNCTNTIPGMVDGHEIYPEWYDGNLAARAIILWNPWMKCGEMRDFVVHATNGTAGGPITTFESLGRVFTFNKMDRDGYPIGGDYNGTGHMGSAELEKSDPRKTCYDQIRLRGYGSDSAFNVVLPLVEQNGYIGVANLASLDVIEPCGPNNSTAIVGATGGINGGVDENSQFWIPLGRNSHGQPAVILDVNGDCIPDEEFMQGPPVCGWTVKPEPVPTVSQWGLMALTAFLLILGLRFARGRGRRLSV